MKIFCLILGCLLYSVQGQFGGLFGGGKPGVNAPIIGNIKSPVEVPAVPVLADLEKLFLQDWLDFGVCATIFCHRFFKLQSLIILVLECKLVEYSMYEFIH